MKNSLNLQTEEKHWAVSKNVGNRDVIGRYVYEIKVSIIESTDIVKEQDNNVQEEADDHNVNETGKDKKNRTVNKKLNYFLCRRKVQITQLQMAKRASKKTQQKKIHEIFHIGKIRAVDTVRLWTPDAAWGICDS